MPTNRNSKKYTPVNRAAVSSKYVPVNRASSLPPKEKTFGEKAVDVGKDLVKAVVSPVATMVARPIQLGAMLAGVSTENIDKFTMGGLIAPTPKNGKDVVKDIGRGIETVALGIPATKATKLFGNTIKPISSAVAPAMIGASKLTPKAVKTANVLSKSVGMGTEGAVFGYGQGLEQTGEPLGAETLKTTAMGAGIGAVLPIAGAGLSKVFGKKATTGIESIANKTDDVVNKVTPEQPIVNKAEIPTQAVPEQGIPEQPKINQTPEYVASVEQRASKLADDPEFQSSSDKSKIIKFDEVKTTKTNEQMIDYVTGKDPSVIDGLPKTSALKLMREDVIANPTKYTPAEVKRLTSNYASSQAGADLQATQVGRKAIIDNPFDAITLAERELKDVLKKKGITKKNIINFLDDNQCTL